MIGEFELIRKLIEGWKPARDVSIGPGDDSSAIVADKKRLLLQSTDLLLENVHFRKGWGTPYQLGWKALAVNLSDIAAMGGTPSHTHLNLAVPPTWSETEIIELMSGFKAMADRYGVSLLGGDLSSSPDLLVVSVFVNGNALESRVIRRDGAKPGDIIWVSGLLGSAAAGLELLKNNIVTDPQSELLNPFLMPQPEIELGTICAQNGSVNALIDISDGLAGDLGHILEASNTGAKLIREDIPLAEDNPAYADLPDFDRFEFALRGGEDYRLLGCTPRSKFDRLNISVKNQLGRALYAIGEIESETGLRLISQEGGVEEIKAVSHDHFKRSDL